MKERISNSVNGNGKGMGDGCKWKYKLLILKDQNKIKAAICNKSVFKIKYPIETVLSLCLRKKKKLSREC